METSLVKYKRNLPARTTGTSETSEASSFSWLLGLALVGLIIWLFVKNKSQGSASPVGQYLNEESWDVSYNEDGLPTKITIHRNATRR